MEVDGIREWHPSFLQLAPTLRGYPKRYERFCQHYRHHTKCPLHLCQGVGAGAPVAATTLLLAFWLQLAAVVRWALRTEIPTASAGSCRLRPLARLAMYRSLTRNDRGAGIAGFQTVIGTLLSRPETRLCSCAVLPI